MKIKPNNEFTNAITKIKESLNNSISEIDYLKNKYINQELTDYEKNYLEHFDCIKFLLTELKNDIRYKD
ncbi:hypothetical protein FO440_17705 [Mucilaginibacter corticis]|uniref:Uncharacterized protein n=1 Tax=Mucilaginibacter corticis TaxID=2597670 RepID=A0A556MI66_9SPHI|nr:hypothetical protein [Mucilaginibacter corticis]TSJ39578.1 hypothetical protein FO440_17705 [Mucilaginibacter corticis]